MGLSTDGIGVESVGGTSPNIVAGPAASTAPTYGPALGGGEGNIPANRHALGNEPFGGSPQIAPAPGSSLSSTASLTLIATGTTQAATTGSASIAFSAIGDVSRSASATASLTLGATGSTSARSVGSASLTFGATGTLGSLGTASGTAALTFSATGTLNMTSGSATGSASFALTASGATGARATSTGTLALTATGTATATARSSTAALMLTASGSVSIRSTATLTLGATGSMRAKPTAAASISLSATGSTRARTTAIASLTLGVSGTVVGRLGLAALTLGTSVSISLISIKGTITNLTSVQINGGSGGSGSGVLDQDGNPLGNVWSDGDDATYAPIDYIDYADATGPLVADTNTGPIASMRLHFRASATGTDPVPLVVQLNRAGGARDLWIFGPSSQGSSSRVFSSTYGGGPFAMDWLIPNDGVIRDYAVDVSQEMVIFNGWDNLDELREDLASGECSLYFWPDAKADNSEPHGRALIYEASLEVGHLSPTWMGVPAAGVTADDPNTTVVGGNVAWSDENPDFDPFGADRDTYTQSEYNSANHGSYITAATAHFDRFTLPGPPTDLTLYLQTSADWTGHPRYPAVNGWAWIGCEPYLWTEDDGFLAGFYETPTGLFNVVAGAGGAFNRAYTMTEENLADDGNTLTELVAKLQTGVVNLSVRARGNNGETGTANLTVYGAYLVIGYGPTRTITSYVGPANSRFAGKAQT